MSDTHTNPEAEKPSSVHHAFRISLNLTRRVVRRMIELEQSCHDRIWTPQPRASNVPDPATFQFSLRVLRRVLHRVIEQAGAGTTRPQPA